MYKVTGANLFGQWLEDDRIISEFRTLSNSKKNQHNFNINQAKLTDINWSYNIFQIVNSFYVTGCWDGQENNIVQVELPQDCNTTESQTNLEMIGDDYSLFLIDKMSKLMWVIDIENNDSPQKVNFNMVAPLENSSKRPRQDSQIKKVGLTYDSVICLTTDGKVYKMLYDNGVQPTLMDTSHCVGKVCDIQCGYEHFMLLTQAGRVYTWGNGRRLQLGHGALDNLESPKQVDALAGIPITKISAGGWHCLALSEFGDLYTWGWNDTGQLGVRHPDNKGVLNREGLKSYPLPTLVDMTDDNDEIVDTNVVDIACGSRHSAILLADDSIWTTGYNKYGQLGFPIEDKLKLDYYRKAFECEKGIEINCGQWSTVLINHISNK